MTAAAFGDPTVEIGPRMCVTVGRVWSEMDSDEWTAASSGMGAWFAALLLADGCQRPSAVATAILDEVTVLARGVRPSDGKDVWRHSVGMAVGEHPDRVEVTFSSRRGQDWWDASPHLDRGRWTTGMGSDVTPWIAGWWHDHGFADPFAAWDAWKDLMLARTPPPGAPIWSC